MRDLVFGAELPMNENLAIADQVKRTALDLAVRFGPKLLVAVLILCLGLAASRWTSRWTTRGLARIELEPPVRQLLARAAWLMTFALFIVIALQNLGVELLPLIAGLGVVGAGLALATQGVLSNVVAGLSIIFTKPFKVGEYISVVHEEGRVDTITLFNTTLSHSDRSRIVIPNRKITGEILHNFGTIRQVEVRIGVAYETDLDAAFALIRAVLQANPRVLQEPSPVIQTTLLGDWSVVIGVHPWVKVPERDIATSEINGALLASFRKHNIVMPVPMQEVRLLDQGGNR